METDAIVLLMEKKRDLLAQAAEIRRARRAKGMADEEYVIEAEVRLCDAEVELATHKRFVAMNDE